jgi:hypothetical protein
VRLVLAEMSTAGNLFLEFDRESYTNTLQCGMAMIFNAIASSGLSQTHILAVGAEPQPYVEAIITKLHTCSHPASIFSQVRISHSFLAVMTTSQFDFNRKNNAFALVPPLADPV